MNIDFPTILVLLTIFTGVVSIVDFIYCFYQKRHGKAVNKDKTPIVIDYSRALFPILLIVVLIRSFVLQPYRVPSGSLKPTVMPGDFILVNQFQYGLRLPVWKKKIMDVKEPKIGDIALLYWPVNAQVTFVKRVIGTPGDRISYKNKVLYVNGREAKQTFVGYATDQDSAQGPSWKVAVYEEDLNGVKHKIYVCASKENCPTQDNKDFSDLVVPPGKYFMMGDNRDNSDDCRDWGFVSESELVGKALFVFMNWNPFATHWYEKIAWHRIGKRL
jgi:signal peptidase I